jgi:hypothetical protein
VVRFIERATDISASPEAVWRVLTELARYPEWNPFLSRIDGSLIPGARLSVDFGGRGSRKVTMRPRVLVVAPGRELRWLGKLGIGGLFNGEHSFRIETTTPSTVRFVQSEKFTGLLVPLLGGVIRQAESGFEEMNAALKQRVETGDLAVGGSARAG